MVDEPSIENPTVEEFRDEPVPAVKTEEELVHPRADIVSQMREEYLGFLEVLNKVTNEMAEDLRTIKEPITGKGVSPVHSAFVVSQLQEIENKLRMIGGSNVNPIPFIPLQLTWQTKKTS